VGGTAALAVLMFTLAAISGHGTLPMIATVFALSACGSSAGYVLDEFAVGVADASPTSRTRRVQWRLVALVAPVAVGFGGLAALAELQPDIETMRLAPFAAGAIATGVGVAACLRRAGRPAPGGGAAAVVFLALTLLAVANPLQRWLPAATFAGDPHAGRTVLLWTVLVSGCVVLTATSARDPGRSPVRS